MINSILLYNTKIQFSYFFFFNFLYYIYLKAKNTICIFYIIFIIKINYNCFINNN